MQHVSSLKRSPSPSSSNLFKGGEGDALINVVQYVPCTSRVWCLFDRLLFCRTDMGSHRQSSFQLEFYSEGRLWPLGDGVDTEVASFVDRQGWRIPQEDIGSRNCQADRSVCSSCRSRFMFYQNISLQWHICINILSSPFSFFSFSVLIFSTWSILYVVYWKLKLQGLSSQVKPNVQEAVWARNKKQGNEQVSEAMVLRWSVFKMSY